MQAVALAAVHGLLMVSACVFGIHGAVFLPALPRAVRDRPLLGALLLWLLERLCGLKFVVEGRERIPGAITS
jgi:hypothetical protein